MPDHVFADPETATLVAGARVEAAPAEDGLSDHAPVTVEVVAGTEPGGADG